MQNVSPEGSSAVNSIIYAVTMASLTGKVRLDYGDIWHTESELID